MSTSRVARVLAVLTAALALTAALGAEPAQAAGTGGIEVDPYPGVVGGHQVTAFHVTVPAHGDVAVRYSLRNTTAARVHGRLYAAAAVADGHGGWTIAEAGSSPYVGFADQQVVLAPHESRIASFTVHGDVRGTRYAALVVEVRQGAVVTRAATLVYLAPGSALPLPALVVGAAVLLLLAGGAGVLRARERPATRG